MWGECWPRGQWIFLNSGAATSTCGSPCQIFEYVDDYDFDDDANEPCNFETLD